MILDIEFRTEAMGGDNVQGDREKIKDMRISHFDKNGDIAYLDVDLSPKEAFTWQYANPGDRAEQGMLSWDRRPVRRARSLRLNRYRAQEIMVDRADEVAPALEMNIPKKFIIDIETEVQDGFESPETARCPVTAISIVNCADKKVTVLGLKELKDSGFEFVDKEIREYFAKHKLSQADKWVFNYVKFESEYDMLYTFFAKLIHKMPCVTGWNILGYDWPYLVNRCDRLKIDPSLASPTRVLLGKDRLPQHRLIVDYMDLVAKWDRVLKLRESMKLDYIAEAACGMSKVKYTGTLKDLYIDFPKFVYYSAVDSILVHYIDRRLNTMNTFFKLSQVAQVELNRTFSPVSVQEALMGREFYKRSRVIVDIERSAEQKHFEGAYVKEPEKGLHQWITCFDFASLYPSVIRQFNISPDSYKGRSIDGKAGASEILAANGNIFDASEDSVLRVILDDIYAKRKFAKTSMIEIHREISYLESLL